MGDQNSTARSAAAWRLARTQHGVLTRSDLLGLGFSSKGIKHRVASGRLHPISTGIYAVGRPELTPRGRWMAAVLVCGDGAMLSHRSAAQLWGIGFEERGRIDVTVRRRAEIHRAGLKVRARPSLDARSVVRRFGIPVTTPVQTLIDLATELKILRLERAVNEADKLDLVDPESLRRALDGYVGMPGVRTLRTMLDRHTFRLSDSDLEIFFRPLALAYVLATHDAEPHTFYAAPHQGEIYRSADAGLSWESLDAWPAGYGPKDVTGMVVVELP